MAIGTTHIWGISTIRHGWGRSSLPSPPAYSKNSASRQKHLTRNPTDPHPKCVRFLIYHPPLLPCLCVEGVGQIDLKLGAHTFVLFPLSHVNNDNEGLGFFVKTCPWTPNLESHSFGFPQLPYRHPSISGKLSHKNRPLIKNDTFVSTRNNMVAKGKQHGSCKPPI